MYKSATGINIVHIPYKGTIQAVTDLVAGQKPGRSNDEAIKLFDSSGLGLQDVAAAAAIYHRALERGAGNRLALN